MPAGKKAGDLPLIEGKMLALYIVVAVGVCFYVFVKTLDGAASFNQQYDNYAHF